MRRAMAARPANTMTKKIPLAIDARPLAQAIDKSVRRTMTKNIMTYIAEILAVALILLLGVAILSI